MAARVVMLGLAIFFWLSGAVLFIVSMVTVQWLSQNVLGITLSNLNLFKTCAVGNCVNQGERIRTCAFPRFVINGNIAERPTLPEEGHSARHNYLHQPYMIK